MTVNWIYFLIRTSGRVAVAEITANGDPHKLCGIGGDSILLSPRRNILFFDYIIFTITRHIV